MIVIVIIDISEVCHYIIYWFNSVETFWPVLKWKMSFFEALTSFVC